MRKPAKKNVAEGRGHACPPLGELTCSESQAEDMFSAGNRRGTSASTRRNQQPHFTLAMTSTVGTGIADRRESSHEKLSKAARLGFERDAHVGRDRIARSPGGQASRRSHDFGPCGTVCQNGK